MKRIGKTILAVSIAVLMAFGVTACGAKGPKGTLTLSAEYLSAPIGATAVFSATFESQDADAESTPIHWKSSKASVATVDENGVLTAKKAGKATITATCGKAKASCVVEVFDGANKEEVTAEDARVNVSKHQSKMEIRRKKVLAEHFSPSDAVIGITDGQGRALPFEIENDVIRLFEAGDIGVSTWKFYTQKKVVAASVCHATHIVGVLSDFAALSDDWDKATLGNGNELFVDWKATNATKDWYVALDDNIDGAMGIEYLRYYTFGRKDAKDGGFAVFNGTFDGRGYALKGMRTERGFITILGPTGVIKNTAFIKTRCGEVGGGGVLGWVGFGTVENVFIQADLYYESQHQSGMYWYTDKETPLTVKDCLVMIEMKEGGGKWPSGDWNNPGFFSTNGVDNGNAQTNVIDSYGISACFTRVDGARDGTEGIAFKDYEAFLASGAFDSFGDTWEFGPENIFFGGELVFSL